MNYEVELRLKTKAPAYEIPIVRTGACRDPQGHVLGATNAYLTMDGIPWQPIAGECHFSRLNEAAWDVELGKIAAGGINTVSTYVFWNHHESREGTWDFKDGRNLRRFLTLCSSHGLFAIVRIGPFCHAEVRNGGLPDWMYGKPYEVRSLDDGFLRQVRIWYRRLAVEMAGLYFKDGGPVFAVQLDNEYMSSSSPWALTQSTSRAWIPSGKDGIAYLRALRDIAVDEGIDVPLFTCTGWGSPVPNDMFPLWGGYAYRPWLFYDGPSAHPVTDEYLYRDYRSISVVRNADFDPPYDPRTRPYACCEMGGGMFNAYNYRFVLPMASVDAMANIKLGSGCNLLGYYMYHGGNNPVSSDGTYLNEEQVPKRSYDFQAPIGSCGQIRESYRRLKTLHQFIKTFGRDITVMSTVLPAGQSTIAPGDGVPLRFAVRTDGRAGFVFLNNFQDHCPLPVRNNESIQINLASGEHIDFDRIGLAADENCILPFHMNLDGIDLIAATAQPVTYIDAPSVNGRSFVFMRPDGMSSSAFIFPQGTLCNGVIRNRFEVGNGDFERFTVDDAQGHTVEIICVSRTFAGCMTVIAGRTLIFTDPHSAIYRRSENDDGVMCLESPRTVAELLLYPSDGATVTADLASDSYGMQNGLEQCEITQGELWQGDLSIAHFSFAKHPLTVSARRIHDDRFVIHFSSEEIQPLRALDAVAVLDIDYLGDVGSLWLDGSMIDDNFSNGETWSIDLTPYLDRLQDGVELVLVVEPNRVGTVVDADSPMAARTLSSEYSVPRLQSITMHLIHHATFMMRTAL